MFRLAVMGFMWDLSTPIALPLSAWLYNSGGYVCVMAVSLLLFLIAAALGLGKLWNFQEKIGKHQVKLVGECCNITFYEKPVTSSSSILLPTPGNISCFSDPCGHI